MKPLSRAEMRDWLRRRLNIVPPVDQITATPLWGPAGSQPGYAPIPTNAQLNDFIDEALSTINTETGFHSFVINLTIPITSVTMGVQKVKLSLNDPTETGNGAAVTTSIGNANINSVRRALWTDASATEPQQLIPSPYRISDREMVNFDAMLPGIPTNFFIEGYGINLYPASANGGTLTLWIGTGLLNPLNDAATIDQLPADYIIDVLYNVMVVIGQSRLMSVEMRDTALAYAPKAQRGILKIAEFTEVLVSPREQASIGFASPRNAVGLRRRRR